MRTDALVRQTRMHFPRLDEQQVEITPIEKGGSDRKFYRVSTGEQTLVLVKYNVARAENRHYVAIAQFLTTHRILVPKIYFHDEVEGLIWIEDLGKRDLWAFRDDSWQVRAPLYRAVLHEIAKLHSLPLAAAGEIAGGLQPEFDATLYRWEQGYFFENCLGRYFNLSPDEVGHCAALPVLHQIAERLATRSRVLVHRDFQSQNIIVRDGETYLIDFQGMRPGLAEYDLASLLFDPYVQLTSAEREELLSCYIDERARRKSPVAADMREAFCCCAIQRLMQALGAYGFLGLVKGNKAFLTHIAPAMQSLRGLVSTMDDLKPLQTLLGRLR